MLILQRRCGEFTTPNKFRYKIKVLTLVLF